VRPINGIFFTGKMRFSAVAEVALLEHAVRTGNDGAEETQIV